MRSSMVSLHLSQRQGPANAVLTDGWEDWVDPHTEEEEEDEGNVPDQKAHMHSHPHAHPHPAKKRKVEI